MPGPKVLVEGQDQPESVQYTILLTCVVLQSVGFVGCLLILLTALVSRNVQRHSTWISFMITWVVSSAAYLLLFLSGNLHTLQPIYGLCLAQATMIYAVPIMTAASTLALVTQVLFNVRNLFRAGSRRNENVWTFALLMIPYQLLSIMLVACLLIGLYEPETVHRSDLQTPYCNMINRIPSKISSISVASLMIPTIVLEVVICGILKRNWRVLRNRTYPLTAIFRVIGFSVLGMLAVALSVLFAASEDRDPEVNIIISALSPSAFLIFGTQHDIIRAWMFWRKEEVPEIKDSVNSRTELGSNFQFIDGSNDRTSNGGTLP
ncbi:hypothetical protein CPC08DRAFT_750117 [Agrocybe pediades]|nr:hypothetical protein CPC08DRAFT_750117 [Agrocybe pediades]